jgi:hypothetical protein
MEEARVDVEFSAEPNQDLLMGIFGFGTFVGSPGCPFFWKSNKVSFESTGIVASLQIVILVICRPNPGKYATYCIMFARAWPADI